MPGIDFKSVRKPRLSRFYKTIFDVIIVTQCVHKCNYSYNETDAIDPTQTWHHVFMHDEIMLSSNNPHSFWYFHLEES